MTWDPRYRYYIPVQLCHYALSKNLSNPFRLYCYLKGDCSGVMKIDIVYIDSIAADLKCNPKSITNNLRKLRELNWIGHNPMSDYYFIRSFHSVMKAHGFTSRTGAEFKKDYLKDFKAFIAGVLVGYVCNSIRRKQAAERKRCRSIQAARLSDGQPVATRLIANRLNVSLGTAHKLKKLAASAGFIKIQKSFINTGVNGFEKKFYQKTFPEMAGRIRDKKGALMLVDTDKIVSNIHFKTRKKRER
jgi:hypothetical protein